MNIKGFHIVFITLSVILAFGFASFLYSNYADSKATGDLIASAVSALVGIGMLVYGVRFVQKLRRKAL